VLFGVAVFLGHHWSIESEHLIALQNVSALLVLDGGGVAIARDCAHLHDA
jgi:hypothetical protein